MSGKPFLLNGREFGYLNPYLIAEIGVNHEGSIERARRMIEAVAAAGGHAAKFQTYKAELLATRDTSPAYWDRSKEATESQYALFQRWDTFGDDDYRALSDHCAACGIDFISTPFDLPAVDLLAPIAPLLKVASADLTNIPLLRKIGRQGLPVVMSVGASRPDEIATALAELHRAGAANVTLLHCVLNYPTPPAEARLAQIAELTRVFGSQCAIGYSDHVTPDVDGSMPALDMAALLGSVVIEKHFTDDRTATGNDHYHAMDGKGLAAFVNRLARLRELYGDGRLDLSGQKAAIDNARRRIVTVRGIDAGAVLGEDDLIALRSNRGIEIAHWDKVVGRTLARAVSEGAALDWADFQ